jgi:GNAT superfamily N-acetyltransferase
MKYTPPEPLNPEHDIEKFDCGEQNLNEWLKKKALKNEKEGASRTYVVRYEKRVVGYYCLATGSVIRNTASNKVKRNMPDPIPVMVLGRLAVDVEHQKKGIGTGLIKDAVMRTFQASEIIGVRAIVIHAINEEMKDFYVDRYGFTPSPLHPLTVMATLKELKELLDFESE